MQHNRYGFIMWSTNIGAHKPMISNMHLPGNHCLLFYVYTGAYGVAISRLYLFYIFWYFAYWVSRLHFQTQGDPDGNKNNKAGRRRRI